ncbi:MAG: hypothetical protein F7B60_02830 [Desulfurococcales archaeon]|nr:hypothetical protein [Desulfurococcales archaeon]
MANTGFCGKKGEKPPYATGFIVDDYGPLFAYWRIARSENREDLIEKALIHGSDIDMLMELASSRNSLGEFLDILSEKLSSRIDQHIALKAVQACNYKALNSLSARQYISRILAGWLVELGESTGRIVFSTRRNA